MADSKKGFMLYADLIHTISKMPDDKAGQLFKIILNYVNDKNPEIDDLLLDLTFEPIKQQLKRDLKKWEKRADNSRGNGKLGGRPKKPTETQRVISEPTQTQETQRVISEPKEPVSVNVSVNVKERVITPLFLKDLYKNLISSKHEDIQEMTSINEIIKHKDLFSKIEIGLKNYANSLSAKDKREKLFFFIRDKIYMDYQEESANKDIVKSASGGKIDMSRFQ